ncbi:hypothetical protein [Saccharomonospora iraqiensis]|uniref:hypothetical protein n=1 Tax=Saccharomonospora iraqiensis TaxID=52698 RepID=UPI000417284A|nr:hypothetical protein [Saccharomonospora iraqiensis]
MEYQLTAELAAPTELPDLDALQQVGVLSLLDQRLNSLVGIEGPDGVEITPMEHSLTAHPRGVRMYWLLDAPALAFAEDATRAVLEQTVAETELLEGWEVGHCAVTATDDQLESALAASAGPDDGAPDGPEGLGGPVGGHLEDTSGTPLGRWVDPVSAEREADIADRRARLLRSGAHLGAFDPSVFGTDLTDEQARSVAGALLHGVEMLTDELFADIQLLDDEDATADEVEALWALDELPQQFADRYTALFAKQFLVATALLGHRLTRPGWRPPMCVAEALALHIAECRAEVELDLADVLDGERVAKALAAFNAHALTDTRHELLYDVAEEDLAPDLAFDRWFAPTGESDGRALHPYLADEDD